MYDWHCKKRYRHFWRLALAVLVLLLTLVAINRILLQKAGAPGSRSKVVNAKFGPKPTAIEGHYLLNGTIFWGRRVQQWSTKANGSLDYTFPFSGLSTFGRQNYDGWVADLECPTTTTDIPMAKQENELVFNCKPEYLPEAAKYFNIIDLANNHSDNAGRTGLDETRMALAKAGIQTFGDFEPARTGDTCQVISLPVRLQMSDTSQKIASLPVAFCAWHYFYRLPLPGEIEQMKKYAKLMPVFAFVHMGREYQATADPIQQMIAHKVADQGPQFVIANNPHWVQNSEVYNGKLIVYSTGNFIFDQQGDAEVTRSDSIEVSISASYDANLAKWLTIGPDCRSYNDTCLQKVTDQKLSPPKLKLTFAVIAGDNSQKLTKKASPDIQTAVEQRLNWSQTLKLLGQSP